MDQKRKREGYLSVEILQELVAVDVLELLHDRQRLLFQSVELLVVALKLLLHKRDILRHRLAESIHVGVLEAKLARFDGIGESAHVLILPSFT